ncbi:hypothetical protein KK470_29675, partial [Klebsiella pneumoniae]|uniref:hypothetical protein n=1 Tax=Klebsiella pneumoniae TaxID=573 RepID=UPI001BE02F7D
MEFVGRMGIQFRICLLAIARIIFVVLSTLFVSSTLFVYLTREDKHGVKNIEAYQRRLESKLNSSITVQ